MALKEGISSSYNRGENSLAKIPHYPYWRIDSVASFLQSLSPPIFFHHPSAKRQQIQTSVVQRHLAGSMIQQAPSCGGGILSFLQSTDDAILFIQRFFFFCSPCQSEEICNKELKNNSFAPYRKHIDYHLSKDLSTLKQSGYYFYHPRHPKGRSLLNTRCIISCLSNNSQNKQSLNFYSLNWLLSRERERERRKASSGMKELGV